MAEIVTGITEVHGIMGNIADVSRPQAEKLGGLHTMLDGMQVAAAGTSQLACGGYRGCQAIGRHCPDNPVCAIGTSLGGHQQSDVPGQVNDATNEPQQMSRNK